MGHWFIDGTQLRLRLHGEAISPTADEVFRCISEHEMVWPEVSPGQPSELGQLTISPFLIVPKATFRWDSDNNELILGLEYSSHAGPIECNDAKALNTGHLVRQNKWMPVDANLSRELLELLDEGKLSFGPIKSLKEFLFLIKVAPENKHLLSEAFSINDIPTEYFLPLDSVPPCGIQAILYDYQLSGWKWLKYIVAEGLGGLLADEMGLGKTLQIISLLADPGDHQPFPALVVAPGSLLENWCREFEKFAPQLNVLKHSGQARSGSPTALSGYDIIVCSYETVSIDNSLLQMFEWSVVVVDEAQNIKNPAAKRTVALKKLKRQSAIAVTGTPVENSLTDIWSIIDFLLPDFLGTQKSFEKKFEGEISGAELLEKKISPLILRRLIKDVAQDLPSRIDIPQFIDLSDDEVTAYESIRNAALEAAGTGATLSSLTSLRMFCCHPQLTEAHVSLTSFSKMQRLKEILVEIFSRSEKALIFCSFTKASDLIVDLVRNELGTYCEALDGRVDIDERQSLVDRFSSVEGSACLVLNPRVGGAGLNITAANHVIHYNPEWNPAVEDQASARAHRRGQTQPVTVHRLLLANTVEEVVNERLARKRHLAGAAIVGVVGDKQDYAEIIAALQRSPAEI